MNRSFGFPLNKEHNGGYLPLKGMIKVKNHCWFDSRIWKVMELLHEHELSGASAERAPWLHEISLDFRTTYRHNPNPSHNYTLNQAPISCD